MGKLPYGGPTLHEDSMDYTVTTAPESRPTSPSQGDAFLIGLPDREPGSGSGGIHHQRRIPHSDYDAWTQVWRTLALTTPTSWRRLRASWQKARAGSFTTIRIRAYQRYFPRLGTSM